MERQARLDTIEQALTDLVSQLPEKGKTYALSSIIDSAISTAGACHPRIFDDYKRAVTRLSWLVEDVQDIQGIDAALKMAKESREFEETLRGVLMDALQEGCRCRGYH